MTTILAVFLLALIIGLAATPLAAKLGRRLGAMDLPGVRKVHQSPIPRSGGAAIFFSVLATLIISSFFMTDVSRLLVMTRQDLFLLLGACVAFAVGVADDFRGLPPRFKLVFQILAATVAYYGGVRISAVSLFGVTLSGFPWCYLITVFWFVLFINAVNLVDGLDGLAGGIAVFASAIMVVLAVTKADYLTAMLFAALGGAALGFLRYNFNPASVFLGDGGTYFLGYAIAGLSILGSIKSQVGAAVLIPLVALGVPVFDTILSPIRRFIYGQKAFSPDDGHIHHKLKQMGFSIRKAVLLLYGVTVALCGMAVALVNVRDERAGLLLIVLGAAAFILVRKLGYFEYFSSDKIYGWLKDMTDVAGLSHERRSFLSLQTDMTHARTQEELFGHLKDMLGMLEFDMAEFEIRGAGRAGHFLWHRSGFDPDADICGDCLLKLELPLLEEGNGTLGTLWLIKDLKKSNVSHYTLRRVEHLRRTVNATLLKLISIPPFSV